MDPLAIAREHRAQVQAAIDALNTELSTRSADTPITAEENARIDELLAQRAEADERIADLEAQAERRANLAGAASPAGAPAPAAEERRAPTRVEGKDTVYARDGGVSYFKDLAYLLQPGSAEFFAAQARLQEHAQMVDRAADDLPTTFRSGPQKRMGGWGKTGQSDIEARVNPTRVGGQGGYAVPPMWLINDIVPYLRAGRTTADLFTQDDLPAGTDSINIPKLTLGTLVGVQQDGGAVTSQDLMDTYVTAPVRTLAGQEDVAMALLDQSPIAFDQVIMKDLMASYAQQVDIGCISGSGSNGQLKGVLNITGTNAVTFTNASPTLPLFYTPLMQSISQIAKQRFQPPSAISMHPSTWYFYAAGLDSQNRPLISVEGQAAFNAIAQDMDLKAVEGLVGVVSGIPIYVDANIPVNQGSGANQAPVLVAKFDDLWLFEGAIRFRALQEVLSGTLQVRFQA